MSVMTSVAKAVGPVKGADKQGIRTNVTILGRAIARLALSATFNSTRTVQILQFSMNCNGLLVIVS